MINITRRLTFHAGHRVLEHESKCKHLHGHSYVAQITVTAPRLDGLGRVIDFGVIKERVGGWIDANLDHNMVLNPNDPLALLWTNPLDRDQEAFVTKDLFEGKQPFIMPEGFPNPTAENLARLIHNQADVLLAPLGITIVNCRIIETENCWADYGSLPSPFLDTPVPYDLPPGSVPE